MKSIHIYASFGTSVLVISALPQPAFGQVADSWAIAGDVTVEANNTDAAVSVVPAEGALISGAAISDGSRNSMSISAVGASASVTHNTASFQDLTIGDSIDGDLAVTAANLEGPVTVVGTIDGAPRPASPRARTACSTCRWTQPLHGTPSWPWASMCC